MLDFSLFGRFGSPFWGNPLGISSGEREGVRERGEEEERLSVDAFGVVLGL